MHVYAKRWGVGRCGYQNGIICFYDSGCGGAGQVKRYAHLDFNSSCVEPEYFLHGCNCLTFNSITCNGAETQLEVLIQEQFSSNLKRREWMAKLFLGKCKEYTF